MKNNLVSILVPAYNTDQYIENCLNSVIKQSYKNIEIICVDDGSTDLTAEIIKIYAKKDSRIKLYQQKNLGVGPACQKLLSKSRGKYIAFIDSDDIIDRYYVENLYNAASKTSADIVACKIIKKATDKYNQSNKVNHVRVFNRQHALKELIYMRKTSTGLACKLFDKKLFNNFTFPKSNYSNDFYSSWHAFTKANSVAFLNYRGYHYIYNNNSVTKGRIFHNERLISIQYAKDNLHYVEKKIPKLIKACRNRIAIEAIVILRQIDYKINSYIFQECERCILNNRKTMILDKNIRLKTKAILLLSYFIKFKYLYKRFA